MTTLMQASRQWASRPDDQRFTSLDEMLAHARHQREISRSTTVSSRRLEARPVGDDDQRKSLAIIGPDEAPTVPTHWSFGQLAQRVKAPAGYLRNLPADIAADCLNWGFNRRGIEDVGVLLRADGQMVPELAAATGPGYGRVWNEEIIAALVQRFGNGVDGDFTVPGEFGRAIDVSRDNTTLFASDRDMFAFLADEKNRIEVPGRRHGQAGEMARGFFVWNSEVGSTSFGIATFLFDYVCSNRIVWGAQGYEEIRVRHTSGAPDRWIEEVAPAIEAYAHKSTASISAAIEDARARRIGDQDQVTEFLAKRFTKAKAEAISLAHFADEDRPIETLWDAAVGITAYARGVKWQDERVALEREAGRVMAMANG